MLQPPGVLLRGSRGSPSTPGRCETFAVCYQCSSKPLSAQGNILADMILIQHILFMFNTGEAACVALNGPHPCVCGATVVVCLSGRVCCVATHARHLTVGHTPQQACPSIAATSQTLAPPLCWRCVDMPGRPWPTMPQLCCLPATRRSRRPAATDQQTNAVQ